MRRKGDIAKKLLFFQNGGASGGYTRWQSRNSERAHKNPDFQNTRKTFQVTSFFLTKWLDYLSRYWRLRERRIQVAGLYKLIIGAKLKTFRSTFTLYCVHIEIYQLNGCLTTNFVVYHEYLKVPGQEKWQDHMSLTYIYDTPCSAIRFV